MRVEQTWKLLQRPAELGGMRQEAPEAASVQIFLILFRGFLSRRLQIFPLFHVTIDQYFTAEQTTGKGSGEQSDPERRHEKN